MLGRRRAEPDRRLRHELAVGDIQRLHPALTACDVADEGTEFDQFRVGEVLVQLRPELVAGAGRVPADRVGIAQRDPLLLGEQRGRLVVVQLAELALVGDLLVLPMLPGPDSSLVASITAFEHLRYP